MIEVLSHSVMLKAINDDQHRSPKKQTKTISFRFDCLPPYEDHHANKLVEIPIQKRKNELIYSYGLSNTYNTMKFTAFDITFIMTIQNYSTCFT